MPSDVTLSDTARDAAITAVLGILEVDSGGVVSILSFFAGSIPANCDAADTGTPLFEVEFDESPFGAVSSGNVVASPGVDMDVVGDGQVTHFRWREGDGTTHIQGTVGTLANAPVDMQMNDVNVLAGGTVSLDNVTLALTV